MKKIKPTAELKEEMDKYYNKSQGYLNHLNERHTESYFNYYLFFLSKYLNMLPEGSKVLEIGCGSGYSTYLLAKKYPQLNFIGTDVSQKFIEYANQNFHLTNLSFKTDDSLSSSFEENHINMIISTDVIEHIPNIPRLLDESKRILKPDSILIIVTGNFYSPIDPLLDIIKFKTRPPKANTYLSQFKLLFYNIFMSIKKIFNPSFVYIQPDLSPKADNGGDLDAVYCANQMDLKHYLKKANMEILNVGFKGPSLFSKLLGTIFPFFSGIGIVAKKTNK